MSTSAALRVGVALSVIACACGSDETGRAARPGAPDGGVDAATLDAGPHANALHSPREAEDLDPDPKVLHARLVAAPTVHTIAGREISGFSYNGQTPGPTLRAKVGDTLRVELENRLDEATTLHWHGMRVPYAMDGVTWQTDPVDPDEAFSYSFPLTHAGTFWYHPHFNSNGQVDRGLYGVVVVEDPAEPDVDDLVIVFDVWGEGDAVSGHGGSPTDAASCAPHGGNDGGPPARARFTANGLVEPHATLPGGSVVRARLLNVSTKSYLDLSWPGIRQLAADQGLLSALAEPASIVLAPGDRAEAEWLIGDQSFVVENAPYSLNGGATQGSKQALLSVEVSRPAAGPAGPSWPFSGTPPPVDTGATDIVYVFTGDPGTGDWRINGELFPNVTIEELERDRAAVIEVRNASPTEHPFHVHGHAFDVLSVDGVAPAARVFEDTLNVGMRNRLRLRLVADNPGDWMAHCHILDHADRGMMTVLRVLP